MTHLFLFTIGPVQSFINEARKTQDLFISSKIISDLMEDALEWLVNQKYIRFESAEDTDLIFPHWDVQSKPHRLLAFVTTGDINKVGDDLSNYIAHQLLEHAKPLYNLSNSPALINQHISDYFKTYWVAQAIDANQTYSTEIYHSLEAELGMIKNIRSFNQLEGKGRKCTINGKHNVMFYRKSRSEFEREQRIGPSMNSYLLKNKLFMSSDEVAIIDYDDFASIELANGQIKKITEKQLQPGEGLSAISLLKRLYKYRHNLSFPSTAEICLLHLLNSDNSIPSLTAFLGSMDIFTSPERREYQLFFEENLNQRYLEKYGIIKHQNKQTNQYILDELGKQYYGYQDSTTNQFYPGLKKELINRGQSLNKSKYYAIVHFDGDKMGKMLSGQLLKNSNTNLFNFQKKISKLLGDFSVAAANILDQKKNGHQRGRAIFSGGDDFLGLINLNMLFDVLMEFHDVFYQTVNRALQQDYELKQNFTISAGVSIAHYKEPLSIALQNARIAEKAAKEKGDRNAISFNVSKHSGNQHQFIYKWKFGFDGEHGHVLSLAKETVSLLSEKVISPKFIQSLAVIYRPTLNIDNKTLPEILHPGFFTDLSRLIKRASNRPKDKSKVEAHKKRINEYILNLERLLKSPLEHQKNNIENFFQFLFICDFISRNTVNIN